MMKKILLLLLLTFTTLQAETLESVLWKYSFFSLGNNIISIPEYVATYVIELSGYFMFLILIGEILIISFRYASSGFNIQQIRPFLIHSGISIIIVVGIMFTPGIKEATFQESNGKTYTIKTKLLVDLVSSLFASGSVIADVFAYELMFGEMSDNKNLFDDQFTGANKNEKLDGYLMKLATYTAYNLKEKVTLKFQEENKNIDSILDLSEELLSTNHLNKYKEARKNLDKAIEMIQSIISNKIGNGESEINFNPNLDFYIVKNNNLSFKYNDIDGNEKIINEDYNGNEGITNERIVNFNKKVIMQLSEEIDKYNNTYMDNIIKLLSDDLKKLYKQKGFFYEEYYTLAKAILINDNISEDTIYLPGTQIYKLTKNYLAGDIEYKEDSFSSFLNVLTTWTEEYTYIDKKIEKIKNTIKEQNENDYFYNSFYGDMIEYIISTFGKTLKNQLDDEVITENVNYLKELKNVNEKLKNNSKEWKNLEDEINNELSNINNKTLTLNELFKISNILNFFSKVGLETDTLKELIETSTLENEYTFHWWDLGRYYSGLKNIISNNYFTALYYNSLLLNKGLNEKNMNEFLNCLKIDPNLRNEECQVNNFYMEDSLKKIKEGLKTGEIYYAGLGGVASIGLMITKSKRGGLALGGGLGKIGFSAIKMLILFLLGTFFMYMVAPLLFWYVAVINWFLKSSILLVSFCLSFIFLLLENKRDVIYNNLFHLIGQAIVPVFLVGMFFLIINLSNIMDITMYNLVPLSGLGNSNDPNNLDIIGLLLKYSLIIIMNILTILLSFNLFRYLWQVDEFVSEVIGSQVNNTLIQPEKIIHTFSGKMGQSM